MEAYNLYSNNADVKFPLVDTHEEAIPNDILTGLSLSVPEGIVPALTGLRVGIGFVFAVFEDLNTGDAVADVRIDDPIPGRIYPMDMSLPGSGFVMFGPGSLQNEGYFSGQVNVALEIETVTVLKVQPTTWGLNVNDLDYDLENVLEMLSANELVNITIEDNKVYVDRDDTVLGDLDRVDLLDRVAGGGADPRVFTVADTLPDSSGNIDIDVDDCIERCADVNSLEISRGDLASGDAVTLPLDIYFPPKENPDDPCAPSGGSSSGPSEAEDEPLCANVYKSTIVNEDARKIGTLYTHEEPDSSSPSSGESSGSSSS